MVKPAVKPRSNWRSDRWSVGQRSLTDRDRPLTDHDRPLASLDTTRLFKKKILILLILLICIFFFEIISTKLAKKKIFFYLAELCYRFSFQKKEFKY